jgi:hypothetical protein
MEADRMLPKVTRRFYRHVGGHFVAYVALFTALGGSAGAAVIVSSNSQVGPGVIAGSKGAAGTTNNVIKGSLGQADLASGAVNAGKIATGAVTSAKIAAGQVGTAALADGSVTAPKLAAGSVASSAIQSGAVGAPQLGNDVQQSLDVNLTPTAGNPDARDGIQIGDTTVSVDCFLYPGTNAPELDFGTTSKQASRVGISWLNQPSGGSAVQPAVQRADNAANSGTLFTLARNAQGQANVVVAAAGETVTGTFTYVVDATHCTASGQFNRAVS